MEQKYCKHANDPASRLKYIKPISQIAYELMIEILWKSLLL